MSNFPLNDATRIVLSSGNPNSAHFISGAEPLHRARATSKR